MRVKGHGYSLQCTEAVLQFTGKIAKGEIIMASSGNVKGKTKEKEGHCNS